MKHRVLLLPAVLLTAILGSGCATGGAPRVPSTASEPTVSGTPFSQKSPFSSPPQAETTVVGVVEAGVEHGCTLLRTTNEQLYLLVGSADPRIKPGAELSVRGRPNPNLLTTCQQGIPFQVVDVQPA